MPEVEEYIEPIAPSVKYMREMRKGNRALSRLSRSIQQFLIGIKTR